MHSPSIKSIAPLNLFAAKGNYTIKEPIRLSGCVIEFFKTAGTSLKLQKNLSRDQIIFLLPILGELELAGQKQGVTLSQACMQYHLSGHWQASITLAPQSSVVAISITLETLHQLFNVNLSGSKAFHDILAGNIKSGGLQQLKTMVPESANRLLEAWDFDHQSALFASLINAKLTEFFCVFTYNAGQGSCPYTHSTTDAQKIEQAHRHLLNQMSNPPTIELLSHVCGLNPTKLKLLFKQTYGNTIHGYLNNHRLKTAWHLISHQQLAVQEVSSKLGFKSVSHFISLFKKHYGITPKQLSKQKQS